MGTRGRSHHPAAHLVSRALLALIGLVALSLAACTNTGNQGPGLSPSQVFTWPYVSSSAVTDKTEDVAVLDPAAVSFVQDSPDVSMLYSGLVTINSSTLQVQLDAAQSVNISPNGKSYTFVLRPNLQFSDGAPITAADFAYSINRAIGPVCTVEDAKTYGLSGACLGEGPGATYLRFIQGAVAKSSLPPAQSETDNLIGTGPNAGLVVLDPRTLQINLTQPTAFFLDALSYPSSYPVEENLVKKYPGGTWVDHLNEGGCSGPFMVKSYTQGTGLKMVPNPKWQQTWGKKITLTEVDRPFVSDQETEYTAYDKQGQYDYAEVPGDKYSVAVSQSDFHEIGLLSIDYFGLNFKQPPFDNLDVRQAFDLALNKQLLVDRAWDGSATPTNHIVPQGMPGFDEQLTAPDGTQSVTGDQPAATNLIKAAQASCTASTLPLPDYCPYIDAGTKSLPILLYAGVATDPTRQAMATIAVQTWNQVLGLNVKLKQFADLNSVVAALFPTTGVNPAQMWLIGWIADYPDPEDWLSLQFQTGSLYDLSNVSSAKYDSLMNQADSNQNPAQRMTEYHTIEQYMVDQVPWIPLDQNKWPWRLRPWVQGFGVNALQNMEDIDWPNVYIQAH